MDHRESLRKAEMALKAQRKERKLPAPVVSEIISAAMKMEPGMWIMSDSRERMSFLWCCDHISIDPEWIRGRINRRDASAMLDKRMQSRT